MTGLWPTVITLRHPDGSEILMRALRNRDRREWEELRALNRSWLDPWEATNPYGTQPSSFRNAVRYYDSEAKLGRLQPFVIERAGRLIGQMHLFGISWGALRGGAAGYWVSRTMAGRGIAPLCLAALVDHAVYGLELHRVEVNIRPENHSSLRVVDKLGFRDEGLRRGYLHIADAWRDHRTFALTAEDLGGQSVLRRWQRGQHPGEQPLSPA